MNILNRVSLFALAACLSAGLASAQLYTDTQTTLAAAVTSSGSTTMTLSSVANVVATNQYGSPNTGTMLYIVDIGGTAGELDYVDAVNTTTKVVNVRRGMGGTKAATHANGALVIIAPGGNFKSKDPIGSCTAALTNETPWINTNTGLQWLCSTRTLTWVAGWQNHIVPAQVTATVASAAGQITPSGPLFIVSGTAAITGFVLPVGFIADSFTVIPSGVFTTTATNNIALASTAVVGKALTFTYDAAAALFYPSY